MANESGRPLSITLLIAIVVIQGLVAIGSGIALLSAQNDNGFLSQNGLTPGNVRIAAFTAIGIGVLIVLLGLGLGTGSGVARILVALLTFLALLGGIYGIFNYSGTQQTSSIITTIVAVVVLYLLYGSQRNREFFRNN